MAILEQPMPRNSKPKRNDKAVKIERELAVKAGVIAEQFGYDSQAEYLSELLRPLINRDWPKAVKTLDKPKSSKTEDE